eukprot:CAMPEP_0197022804 /NCGR_PEP_ID=MMETSP1384-20130603/3616_1 /TAXON_ID=29189 /ORGANISM="Ammonia sp." /LENGTH=111 /DNA_ID=CAMNT_0042450907 /DNA_START=23 /DNA_END=358 /DNA_ORIENTATION=+
MAEQKEADASKRVHVLAAIFIKEDKVDEFMAAVTPCVQLTNQEKGCITYNCHQDVSDKTKFVMIEEWESKQLLEAHLQSEHVKQLIEASKTLQSKDAVITVYSPPLIALKK